MSIPAVCGLLLSVSIASVPPAELSRARELEAEASALQREGKYREAEKPLRAAVEIWKRHGGPDHIDVLNDEMNLAVSFRRRGDTRLAIELLEKIAPRVAASKDDYAPELYRKTLNNLAVAYQLANRHREARRTFEKLLALLGAGPATEERARVQDNFANTHIELGDLDAAEKSARRALSDWKALRGDDDRDVAISMAVVGGVELRRGRLASARPLLEGSLRMSEKLLGATHPELISNLNLLASLEVREGKLPMAEAHFRRALEIARSAKLSPEHPGVVDARGGLRHIDELKARKKKN